MKKRRVSELCVYLEAKGIPVNGKFQCQAMAQDLGYAFADLDRVRIRANAFADVSPAWIREHRAIPVKRDGSVLYVAIKRPSEDMLALLWQLGNTIGYKVVPVLAIASALEAAIEKHCL